jgi:membrane associated rhomboid family serine protease
VAFLIELTNPREFITQLGWIPAHPFRWLGLTSLTSFFVHAGWLHLLGNLYFLLAFGPGVESRLGVRRFLLLLAIATLVGDVTHALFEPRKELPTIGASGGISALIVFYAVSFPWNRFVVLLGGRWIFWQLSVPAVFYLFCWIGWQLFLLLLQLSGESVSALAHLGGFATGLVAFFVWRRRER